MPSPLAHLATGYVAYRLARRQLPPLPPVAGALPTGLVVAAGYSMLPDMDSMAGLLLGNFGRYHNNVTHSLIVGLAAAALLEGALVLRRRRAPADQWRPGPGYAPGPWFALALICYSLHVLMDAATVSRGVMMFWPLTDARFLSPVALFYGLHWSDGLVTIRHLWTLLTELSYVGLLLAGLRYVTVRQGLAG